MDHNAAVEKLRVVYQNGGSGFGPDHVCLGSSTDSAAMGYGEITYAGMEPLYKALMLKPDDVVYDLGSGLGKLVLYLALRGPAQRVVGIEVGERRHRNAAAAEGRLRATLGNGLAGDAGARSSEFACIQGDIRNLIYKDATVVLFSNLCMDASLTAAAIRNFCKCPWLRTVVAVAPLIPHPRVRLAGMVRVECTWARVSAWNIYELLPDKARLAASGLRALPAASAAGPDRAGILEAKPGQCARSTCGFAPHSKQGTGFCCFACKAGLSQHGPLCERRAGSNPGLARVLLEVPQGARKLSSAGELAAGAAATQRLTQRLTSSGEGTGVVLPPVLCPPCLPGTARARSSSRTPPGDSARRGQG